MPYSFVWSLYFACCQGGRNILWLWNIEKRNKLNMAFIWHIQKKIKFSYVLPLVWNQLCTNFHCTKISKYNNNIVLSVPTPWGEGWLISVGLSPFLNFSIPCLIGVYVFILCMNGSHLVSVFVCAYCLTLFLGEGMGCPPPLNLVLVILENFEGNFVKLVNHLLYHK